MLLYHKGHWLYPSLFSLIAVRLFQLLHQDLKDDISKLMNSNNIDPDAIIEKAEQHLKKKDRLPISLSSSSK